MALREVVTRFVRAGTTNKEFFQPTRNTALLKRVAEATGGRYWSTADSAKLATSINYANTGIRIVTVLPLWSLPLFFVLLILLKIGEWSLRRFWGAGVRACWLVGAFCCCTIGMANGAETRSLIATGLGGNSDYETEFTRHANRIFKQLNKVSDDVTLLSGENANTESLQATLNVLINRTNADDVLILIYVGHGSYNGEVFKFNVQGPDFSATDLARWLEPARAKQQLVVVTGASSGAVQQTLASDGRTVISGTRSGEQRNATVFGRYFSAALEDDAADVDKDLRITAVEAFRYAQSGINTHYTRNNEMTTENPISSGPEPTMVLAHLETLPAVDPGLAHLFTQRDSLEQDMASLRADKASYTEDEYFNELQRLLLELAMIESQLTDPAEATQ